MDYRCVETAFKWRACLLQFVMLGSLAVVLTYRAYLIIQNADAPPVAVDVQTVRSSGKWAICKHPEAPTLYGAGLGIMSGQWLGGSHVSGHSLASQDGSKLSTQVIEFGLWKLSCAIVDLTSYRLQAYPGAFWLCSQASMTWILLESDKKWIRVSQLTPGHVSVQRLSMQRYAWDWGYDSNQSDLFATIPLSENPTAAPFYQKHCHMTQFEEEKKKTALLLVVIDNPHLIVTTSLGIVPQMISLLSASGGLLTVMGLIFTTVFVQKYPDSNVVATFRCRTLIGHQENGNPALPLQDDGKCPVPQVTSTFGQQSSNKVVARVRRQSGVPPLPLPPSTRH
mmetsp:Transcript_101916/g.242958  ORF Transcript_101916/g.242958 Transcript_101916/m.242958 type:complete len:338 (+) Transcript_101916:44-1057(+)